MPVVYHTSGDLTADANTVYIIDSDTRLTGAAVTIPGSATGSAIIVAGEVGADFDAIQLRAAESDLVVEETGRVVARSNAAVWLDANGATLTNAGSLLTIADPSWTVYIEGTGNIVINTGEIRSLDSANPSPFVRGHAIKGDQFDSSTPTVINSGVISSVDLVAPTVDFTGTIGLVTISNSGEILSRGTAIGLRTMDTNTSSDIDNSGTIRGNLSLSSGVDQLMNVGTIFGDVLLNAGADLYRAAGTGLVTGTVSGGAGNDTLTGADADDVLGGGADNDLLKGGKGDDTLTGENGLDTIRGGAGEDSIDAGALNDFVLAGLDDDSVFGSDGSDTLNGGAGDDTLFGGNGLDRLVGGKGDDSLNGGNDNDRLGGGQGNDTLTGGTGSDVFVFTSDGGTDLVTDFVDGADVIDVTAFNFTGFADMLTEATLLSVAGGVRLDFDLGASVTVQGVTLGALTAADFVF